MHESFQFHEQYFITCFNSVKCLMNENEVTAGKSCDSCDFTTLGDIMSNVLSL